MNEMLKALARERAQEWKREAGLLFVEAQAEMARQYAVESQPVLSLAKLAQAFAFQLESQLKLQGKRVGWVGPGTLVRQQFFYQLSKADAQQADNLACAVKAIAAKIPTNCLFVPMLVVGGYAARAPYNSTIVPYNAALADASFHDVHVKASENYFIEMDETFVRFSVLVDWVKEEWRFEAKPLSIDGEAEKRKLEDQVFKPLSPKVQPQAKVKDAIPARALDFSNKNARPFVSPDQYAFVRGDWE